MQHLKVLAKMLAILKKCYKAEDLKKAETYIAIGFQPSGVGRDRTGDTRIFSPLLYRLSYRTFRKGLQI